MEDGDPVGIGEGLCLVMGDEDRGDAEVLEDEADFVGESIAATEIMGGHGAATKAVEFGQIETLGDRLLPPAADDFPYPEVEAVSPPHTGVERGIFLEHHAEAALMQWDGGHVPALTARLR